MELDNENMVSSQEEESLTQAPDQDTEPCGEIASAEESVAAETSDEAVSAVQAEAEPVSGEEEAEEAEDKPRTAKERIAFPLYDFASIIGTAVIAIMVVFTFFFRFVGVIGPSMQPTLFENDWLAVKAIPHDPKAGDIVIVTQPNAFDEPIVKRVIATAGQTVDIREGHVFIDGEMLKETYIAPDVYTEREDLDNYPLTVPEGEVFVLGDNRMHSTDSRSAAVGMIDKDYVLGTVSFRMMPFGKWKVNIRYEYPDM